MRAVVPYIIGTLLAVLDATDTAADRGLARIVLAQLLRIRQDSLEELDRHDLLSVVVDRLDACHANVLDHLEVLEILLPEGHPEARPTYRGEVLDERLQLLVVEQIRLAYADAWVV